MSEFSGLWNHENIRHSLVPPKTEYGCLSGRGITNGHIRYPFYWGTEKKRKKRLSPIWDRSRSKCFPLCGVHLKDIIGSCPDSANTINDDYSIVCCGEIDIHSVHCPKIWIWWTCCIPFLQPIVLQLKVGKRSVEQLWALVWRLFVSCPCWIVPSDYTCLFVHLLVCMFDLLIRFSSTRLFIHSSDVAAASRSVG